MPLRLLERVLPWLVAKLSDEEAQSFLKNMHMAGLNFILCCVTSYTCICQFSESNILSFQHHHLTLHWLPFCLVGHARVAVEIFPALKSSYACLRKQLVAAR